MRSPIAVVDVDRCETWTRYKNGLCDSCAANCCTMPVEVKMADLVRLGYVRGVLARLDDIDAEHPECAGWVSAARGWAQAFQLDRITPLLQAATPGGMATPAARPSAAG